VQRRRDSRTLRLTPAGAIGLAETFGVAIVEEAGTERAAARHAALRATSL
jgi:hypothetical protein